MCKPISGSFKLVKGIELKANLIDLLRDALNAMRMRYQPAEAYDYGLPVFVAVMLAVGVVNAVMMTPLFGNSTGALAFGVLVSVTRWLVLTRVAAEILRPARSPRIPFLGYTLATEALMLPSILMLYVNELAFPLSLWTTWAFWAQAIGFYHISQQRAMKVLAVYVLYALGSMILIAVFLAMFVSEGWLDWQIIQQNLEAYMTKMQMK